MGTGTARQQPSFWLRVFVPLRTAELLRGEPREGLDNQKETPMATQAIVGEKVGMTQTWVDDKVVPVTVVKVDPMRIVQIKTTERDGYTALQVTYGHRDAKKLNKPAAGHYDKAGVQPGKRLVELRLRLVEEFGEDAAIDKMIRKYGYRTKAEIIQLVAENEDLAANPSAALPARAAPRTW